MKGSAELEGEIAMRQRKKDRPAERPVIPGHPRMSAGGSADPIGTGPNLRSAC
jgi:hypothetical protein